MLTSEQIQELLKPLDRSRVKQDGKGFSHVEAWDIRKRMNQIFGFGNWSAVTDQMKLIYEHEREGGKPRYDIAYRARCTVTLHDTGVSYSEWAAGDASNYPSRGDAHDQAIKTAESQAFKRACVNLGDQFGLSLYKDGSLEATVGEVIGQVHADAGNVQAWSDTLEAVGSWEALAVLAAEIAGADISQADKQHLRGIYGAARTRLEALHGPESVG